MSKENAKGFFDFLGKAVIGAVIGIYATNDEFRGKVNTTARKGVDKVKSHIPSKKNKKNIEKSE